MNRGSLRALGAVLGLAALAGGCGDDEASLEERLRDVQDEIEQRSRNLDLRLRCRDRHTGEPARIQACIARGRETAPTRPQNESAEGGPQRPAGGGANRPDYCAAVAELRKSGEELFAQLRRQNATKREFRATVQEFAEENGDLYTELTRTAPLAIRPKVRTVVAADLAQVGIRRKAAPSKQREQAARQRVTRYNRRTC